MTYLDKLSTAQVLMMLFMEWLLKDSPLYTRVITGAIMITGLFILFALNEIWKKK